MLYTEDGVSRATDNTLMRVLGADDGPLGNAVEFVAFGQLFQTLDAVVDDHGPHQGAQPTAGDGVYVKRATSQRSATGTVKVNVYGTDKFYENDVVAIRVGTNVYDPQKLLLQVPIHFGDSHQYGAGDIVREEFEQEAAHLRTSRSPVRTVTVPQNDALICELEFIVACHVRTPVRCLQVHKIFG